MNPQQLCRDLQQGDSDDLKRRRGVIALSLVGIAALGVVTLLQTGLVKHLPDPQIPGCDCFDSDRVNASEDAYRWGTPDGPLGVASFAANLPLAAYGGEDRAESQPAVPLAAAGKAAVDAAAAGWYFSLMPLKEKAWCPYCIVGALANLGILALTLPEALHALRRLRRDPTP
jgi:uncharacterized membrane protein